MTLALNNPMRRLVAHSDKIAITSSDRMSLTGDNGLGIVSDIKLSAVLFGGLTTGR